MNQLIVHQNMQYKWTQFYRWELKYWPMLSVYRYWSKPTITLEWWTLGPWFTGFMVRCMWVLAQPWIVSFDYEILMHPKDWLYIARGYNTIKASDFAGCKAESNTFHDEWYLHLYIYVCCAWCNGLDLRTSQSSLVIAFGYNYKLSVSH